jgi:hypothetical protein
MSGFVCPHCSECSNIFSSGGGAALAASTHVPFLGCIPIDPLFGECLDQGIAPVNSVSSLRAIAQFVDSQLGKAIWIQQQRFNIDSRNVFHKTTPKTIKFCFCSCFSRDIFASSPLSSQHTPPYVTHRTGASGTHSASQVWWRKTTRPSHTMQHSIDVIVSIATASTQIVFPVQIVMIQWGHANHRDWPHGNGFAIVPIEEVVCVQARNCRRDTREHAVVVVVLFVVCCLKQWKVCKIDVKTMTLKQWE